MFTKLGIVHSVCCLAIFLQVTGAVFTIDASDPVPNGCDCDAYSCGCCTHMEVDKIDLNTTVCSNVTYLNEDYGISFTITWNGHALFNETISARNPPPYCIGAPLVKEWAEVCLRFYDLDVSKKKFHGCIEAEAELKKIRIARYKMGCFTIGPKHVDGEEVSVILI